MMEAGSEERFGGLPAGREARALDAMFRDTFVVTRPLPSSVLLLLMRLRAAFLGA